MSFKINQKHNYLEPFRFWANVILDYGLAILSFYTGFAFLISIVLSRVLWVECLLVLSVVVVISLAAFFIRSYQSNNRFVLKGLVKTVADIPRLLYAFAIAIYLVGWINLYDSSWGETVQITLAGNYENIAQAFLVGPAFVIAPVMGSVVYSVILAERWRFYTLGKKLIHIFGYCTFLLLYGAFGFWYVLHFDSANLVIDHYALLLTKYIIGFLPLGWFYKLVSGKFITD